jgi:cell cycle sensor histidine kinase DivJ
VGLFAPIRDYVATLVHPSAGQDAPTAARHRAFIASRLFGGIVALASFPFYLLVRGAPTAVELGAFAWLIVPIFIAYFLSSTGRYGSAHILSSFALTGLITAVAASTGGIMSFAAVWLIVVPLEASLSASRRVVGAASTLALAAAVGLFFVSRLDFLAPAASGQIALATLGIVSAALFATAIALGTQATNRTNTGLAYAEEDRYGLLARNMTDVITRHGRDGSVLFVSPAAQALFGCGIADLSGQGLFRRVHVADRPAYLKALGDTAALGESSSTEFRVRRDCDDGAGPAASSFVWIEMRCRPLEGPSNTTTISGRCDVVAVLRDVTERKLQEQAIEEARSEAERANAAKSRFLATMSHELRTPLNAIIGFSDMLKKEAELMLDAPRRAEYAALINDSGHHLLGVINGILDMSKIETDNFEITPEPFAPERIVAGCCDLLALRACDAGVVLEKLATGPLPDMIADKRALKQILINLLSNAIRFTDRGGKVTIGTRAEAGYIAFVIEDSGVGIGDDDLARLGEPYFQARASYDRRHGGTGLGLSIVKGLVRLHGGEIAIRSRVGEGTRVTVRLPLDCERAAHERGRRSSRHAAPALHVSAMPNQAGSRPTGLPAVDTRVKRRA